MKRVFWLAPVVLAALAAAGPGDAGYRILVDNPYLIPDFDQEDFDNVWKVWPDKLRNAAADATPEQRRAMAFRRYGLTPRPDDTARPLQYVIDDKGRWTMNCFACHGGAVAGRVVPGLPNQRFALETLTDDMRAIKTRLNKPLGRMELGQMMVPLGSTRGTTNAVMFGVTLMHGRDKDLNLRLRMKPPDTRHHDMDAPPWWHFKRRKTMYIDGFIGKGHRSLMTFMLIPTNGPARFRAWEPDFRKVYRYLESIEAPKYPWAVDKDLAARGRRAYQRTCARCHGLDDTYPEKRVPLDEIGTDPERLRALTRKQRADYAASWLGGYGKDGVTPEPDGYVAPPLDGIWASAPYLHNGSVPTLWHLLHPAKRPRVWRRKGDGYDRARIGLAVEELDAVPPCSKQERREYFDTTRRGKSAAGHPFPDELGESEKRAVLEFLKTR